MNTIMDTINRKWTSRSRVKLFLALIPFAVAGCGGGGGGGGTATGANPTVSSVSPATGTVSTELSIVGTNFRSGVQASVGGIALDLLDNTSTTQIFGSVPAGVAVDVALDVVVRNSDGTEVTMTGAFTAVAPTLSYVNSATKPSGNVGSTTIVEGVAFGSLQGPGEVLFSDGIGGTISAIISSPDDWTDTFIVTTVPSGAEDGPIAVTTTTGTSNALQFDVTSGATFSPSAITWTLTTPLPVGVSGHEAIFVPIDDANGTTVPFVHVFGGAGDDGVPQAEVNVAAIQADGTLSAWGATAPLPAGRAFHGVIAATPFNSKVPGNGEIYVLGGIDTVGGQPLMTVYHATLNEDGTVGDGTAASWTETQPLPEALHSVGVAIFRGAIYVAGGATTDNAPVASVYRSRPDEQGELGAWEQLADLPSARSYLGFQSFGGYLYSAGGESAAVSPDNADSITGTKINELAYMPINLRNGDFADLVWTVNNNTIGKERNKHSMVVAGGNLFITSGLYNGVGTPTGTSENIVAQINADGSVQSFTGATGSNTLNSAGAANLFNQAAISYIDANGVSHVMVLGGDDVLFPGTKRTGVLFY